MVFTLTAAWLALRHMLKNLGKSLKVLFVLSLRSNTHNTFHSSGYWEVFSDRRIMGIVAADVFHVIAEANVGLIFNSALAGVGSWSDNGDNGSNSSSSGGTDDSNGNADDAGDAVMARSAIPLLAAAGSLAQIVMVVGTWIVGYLTAQGWGRKDSRGLGSRENAGL